MIAIGLFQAEELSKASMRMDTSLNFNENAENDFPIPDFYIEPNKVDCFFHLTTEEKVNLWIGMSSSRFEWVI